MNSLHLTEKQQEVLWMRYGRKASIDQIAAWLGISRRAVLSRLRNARKRVRGGEVPIPDRSPRKPTGRRRRKFNASQLSIKNIGSPGLPMDNI